MGSKAALDTSRLLAYQLLSICEPWWNTDALSCFSKMLSRCTDYDRIFSILKSVSFTGWISIEDGPNPKTGVDDIAQSAVFLRQKMRQYGLE